MSYLDRKNILSEGFFDSLKKFFSSPKFSAEERKLMKHPGFKKSYTEFKKHIDDSDLDVKYVNKFLGLLALEIWYRLFITKEMSSETTLD